MKNIKRSAVFAHFDKQNIIEDYVIFYLKELKKVTDSIVFVSDCDLDNIECEKIKPFCSKIIAKPHGEYDFGSYKRGYQYLKQNNLLDDMDELILANDSCFGPFIPFREVFNKMETKNCDFWGISKNNIEDTSSVLSSDRHIQSFFIVFKEQVFKNKIFDDFMNKIKREETKEDIINKYEIGLSKYLSDLGFIFDSYCDFETKPFFNTKEYYREEDFVLIKKTFFKDLKPFLIKLILKNIDKTNYYPKNLIFQYLKNKKRKGNFLYSIKILKKLIISIKPKERKIMLLGKTFKF